MAEPKTLEPVTLQSLPTCQNCIAWTDDNLVVAGGEILHILTPSALTDEEKPQRGYWHTNTVRVNQFEEHEWPIPELAPLRELSLGEEQSNSAIVALAWSYEGLGMHKRNVLAVLTSNLLLSLWESNGLAGSWKRTCIINHFLQSDGGKQRLQNRVRAFKWLPPLHSGSPQRKWGVHYLLVADDTSTVTLLQIEKDKGVTFGGWKINIKNKHNVPVPQPGAESGFSSIRSLIESAYIGTFKHGEWRNESHNTTTHAGEQWSLPLMCYRGPSTATMNHHEHYFQLQTYIASYDNPEQTSSSITFAVTTTPDPDFQEHASVLDTEDDVAKVRADFDKQHNLKGRVRVRKWGSAYCQKYSITATCISLHPSDMIEYIIPSMERSTVVFTPPLIHVPEPKIASRSTVLGQVVTFANLYAREQNTTSIIDQRLLQVVTTFARVLMHGNMNVDNSSYVSNGVTSNSVVATNINQSGRQSPQSNNILSSEGCEVCGMDIPVTLELGISRCSKGHTFTRCGLSFLSIQKPGVSKYCSRCGKQFLNMAKLDPAEGPSLIQAIFEEFDVCAYCQGKLRG